MLLAELAREAPVSPARLGTALGAGEEETVAYLHDSPLSLAIHWNEDGCVQGFLGLSTIPTRHRLTVDGRTLWTWCAADTLFLPELLDASASVESGDPVTGMPIRLAVTPAAVESVDPGENRVVDELAAGLGYHFGDPADRHRLSSHPLLRFRAIGPTVDRIGPRHRSPLRRGGLRLRPAPEPALVRGCPGGTSFGRPMNRVILQYFDGCPNWETTDRILSTLVAEGWDLSVEHELIDTYEKATDRGFSGSPTVLVDGVDPFGDVDAAPALACRIYQTEDGPAGSPSIHQLRRVIAPPQKGNLHGAQC